MDLIQSSWFELRKLVAQYLAIPFGSIPAGILYLLTIDITGSHYVALFTSLAVGLLSAHLVWRSVGWRMSVADAHSRREKATPSPFDRAFMLEPNGMALPINTSSIQSHKVKPLSDDPVNLGLYFVSSYERFFASLLR